MVELFKELEDPRNVDRVRYLEGKDPTPTELHEKTEGVNLFWIYRIENTMFMTAISCIKNFYFSFMYFLVYIFHYFTYFIN